MIVLLVILFKEVTACMNKQSIEDILGKKTNVAVLRWLANSDTDGTGREIAKACGLSQGGCQIALSQLEELGILDKRVVGPSYLYKVNKRHPMFVAIKQLFVAEQEWQKVKEQ